MKPVLEVCVDSVESAVSAEHGGADRLELCANLVIGGTTPSPALFRAITARVSIPVRIIIRPRFGDFLYTEEEFEVMKDDLRQFEELGADGFVFGILTEDGDLDVPRMRTLAELANGCPCTLHRAFDVSRDAFRCLEDAISLGMSTILTSGQRATCREGAPLLKELVERADDRIEIMAGSGLEAGLIPSLYQETGITSFHLSGKARLDSGMRFRREGVPMGLPGLSEFTLERCDPILIRAAKEAIQNLRTRTQ